MNSRPHRAMLRLSWPLVYVAALAVDLLNLLLEALAIGIVANRVINIFVTASFAFYFSITGAKGWMFPLFGLGAAEEIPLIGDILAFIPFEWVILMWRIKKKNAEPAVVQEVSTPEEGRVENSTEYQQQEA